MSGKEPTPKEQAARDKASKETLWHIAKGGGKAGKAAKEAIAKGGKGGGGDFK